MCFFCPGWAIRTENQSKSLFPIELKVESLHSVAAVQRDGMQVQKRKSITPTKKLKVKRNQTNTAWNRSFFLLDKDVIISSFSVLVGRRIENRRWFFRFFRSEKFLFKFGHVRSKYDFRLYSRRLSSTFNCSLIFTLKLRKPHGLFLFFELEGRRTWTEALACNFDEGIVHTVGVIHLTDGTVRRIISGANVRRLYYRARCAFSNQITAN